MLEIQHVKKTIEVDYPPESSNFVGRVEILSLDSDPGIASVVGYLGEKVIYHRPVNERLFAIRLHEDRLQRVAKKAAKRIRYDASLIYNLPDSVDLA